MSEKIKGRIIKKQGNEMMTLDLGQHDIMNLYYAMELLKKCGLIDDYEMRITTIDEVA